MKPKAQGRAANRWRNRAQHQAAELRRVACQLRRTAAPTLALKIAAGRIEAIADEIERAAIAPAAAQGRGGRNVYGPCTPLPLA